MAIKYPLFKWFCYQRPVIQILTLLYKYSLMGLDEERVLAKGDPKVKQYNFALSMGGGRWSPTNNLLSGFSPPKFGPVPFNVEVWIFLFSSALFVCLVSYKMALGSLGSFFVRLVQSVNYTSAISKHFFPICYWILWLEIGLELKTWLI